MKIGYIKRIDLRLNPSCKEKFVFAEATCTRKINTRGDLIYSKLLIWPVDYEEVKDNADMMMKNPNLIIVCEPFLLNDELKSKVTKWINWANSADPKEYDPFYSAKMEEVTKND